MQMAGLKMCGWPTRPKVRGINTQ